MIQVEMVLNGMAPLSVLGGSQGALLARADSGQREDRWPMDRAETQAHFCLLWIRYLTSEFQLGIYNKSVWIVLAS